MTWEVRPSCRDDDEESRPLSRESLRRLVQPGGRPRLLGSRAEQPQLPPTIAGSLKRRHLERVASRSSVLLTDKGGDTSVRDRIVVLSGALPSPSDTATFSAASPTTGSQDTRGSAPSRGSRSQLLYPVLAPGPPDGLQQQELDLSVHAPQLVGGPLLQARVELRADPQQEVLARCQDLLVKGSCVDNRLRPLLSAEHDQQVGHHRCLSLLVQLHDLLL